MTLQSSDPAMRDEWRVQWNLVGIGLVFFILARAFPKMAAFGVPPSVGLLFEFGLVLLMLAAGMYTALVKHSETRHEITFMTKGYFPVVSGLVLAALYLVVLWTEIMWAWWPN
jgi:hypothetical protein